MAWRHPRVTVDGLVIVDGKLVAVRRGSEPYRGMPALPGGFVELGERAEDAVVREVREETGLETKVVRLVGVFSDPGRDPRGHTVSVAYALEAIGGALVAGSDAADIVLIDPEGPPPMAFDHEAIVRACLGRLPTL
jgi:8-oxo-dGTP diphosphatase